jgi:general secretion pathway protein H
MARPLSARGFSLLEMILVLVIGAGVFAIVLGVSPKGASSADLKASARALASGLRQTQSTAMATRRDATLTVDLEAREFNFTGSPRAHVLPTGIDMKLLTSQTEVESERKGAIRFYADGSSTGGRITVATGERHYFVDVDWLTGRVAINE